MIMGTISCLVLVGIVSLFMAAVTAWLIECEAEKRKDFSAVILDELSTAGHSLTMVEIRQNALKRVPDSDGKVHQTLRRLERGGFVEERFEPCTEVSEGRVRRWQITEAGICELHRLMCRRA